METEFEPEPDAALLAKNMDQYLATELTIGEMLLVVDASDSTLRDDLSDKAFQYDSAGILE